MVGAFAIVIGGLVGTGAGLKIEQSRTRSEVNRLKAEAAGKGGTTTKTNGTAPGKASTALAQRAGKVTAVGGNTITVATTPAGPVKVHTTSTTPVEQAAAGAKSDITVGSRVLLTRNASDVIVLPKGSQLGRLVATVGSATFSIKKPNGTPGATVPFSDVKTIDTLSAAKFADVKTGTEVLAGGRAAGKGQFNAIEVILLPAGSGFAK